MLRTPLCELLGLEVPILGAPMGPEVSSLELASAASGICVRGHLHRGAGAGALVLLGRPNALCRKGAQGGHQGLRSIRFGEGGKTRSALVSISSSQRGLKLADTSLARSAQWSSSLAWWIVLRQFRS
jgi:hypothetical protein